MMIPLSWLKQWAARLLTSGLRPRRARTLRRRGLQIELLEDRVLLSVVTWTGQGDAASWADPRNWNTGVPGAADTAVINQSGITIKYDGQNPAILGVTSAASL